MPYVPDVGGECSSFSNPAILDGADETSATSTPKSSPTPFPLRDGPIDRGSEVADKCENLTGGQPGGSRYVTFLTGTFAMQGVWANDLGKKGGCENAHAPILTLNPGKQKSVDGTPVGLQINALDLRGRALAYGATGLPAGLAINSSSGLISGIPSARGRSATTVIVADSTASTTIVFLWTTKR